MVCFMKILVCIKQSQLSGEISRFDAHALEAALELKEQVSPSEDAAVSVGVITAGPAAASTVIRRALGLGADTGYHIVTDDDPLIASVVTATRLAAVVREISCDLILTGIQSDDLMAGQTGPMLARMLDRPCATGVVSVAPASGRRELEVERELDNGFRAQLLIRLPAVLSIQAGINIPRYPTLSNMLAARRRSITTIQDSDLFPAPLQSKETCIETTVPDKTRSGRRLTGTLSEQVDQLHDFLRKKDFV